MSNKQEIKDSDIRVVKWLIKSGKSKKECCKQLKIAYNVSRLDKILKDFNEKETRLKELKTKAKTRKFTEKEKNQIVKDYINGESVSSIAERFYLPTTRIRPILIEKQIPIRGRGKKSSNTTEHITQDLSKKYKVGDRIYVVPEPYAEYIDKQGKYKQAFSFGAGYGKIREVLSDTFCDIWDEGAIDEKTIWEPHIDIHSATFRKHWPNGPVEGQHYKIMWQNIEGEWIDRLWLPIIYKDRLSLLEKYGVECYHVVFEKDNFNRFITKYEIYDISGKETNEI